MTADIRNLILVRHAETQWNREGRFQGHLDSRITDEGVGQIQAAAGRLRSAGLDAVYTSDLGRSILTADRIARAAHAPVVVDTRLRERNHGLFEGLTRQQAKNRFPDLFQMYRSGDPVFATPGGESSRQVLDRATVALRDAAKRPGNGNIAVIGHGGLLRVFLNHVLQLPLGAHNGYEVRNCSISVVVYDGERWHAAVLGDVEHLEVLE